MRTLVAALQVSVDGFIEGPNGELDWALAEDEETWRDIFEMLESVDTCILGPVMYPDYEQHWLAALANPTGLCAFRPSAGSSLRLRAESVEVEGFKEPLALGRRGSSVCGVLARIERLVTKNRRAFQAMFV
jgi:hypothetical protein